MKYLVNGKEVTRGEFLLKLQFQLLLKGFVANSPQTREAMYQLENKGVKLTTDDFEFEVEQ